MTDQENMKAAVPDAARRYMRYLLIMAGLGGLLYGVDVGVIAAALPYIEQTAGFNPSQLSQVVAAVLFGSVLSSLFAGYLADKMGRKALITVAAALFTASIPVICLSQEVFGIMLLGRPHRQHAVQLAVFQPTLQLSAPAAGDLRRQSGKLLAQR